MRKSISKLIVAGLAFVLASPLMAVAQAPAQRANRVSAAAVTHRADMRATAAPQSKAKNILAQTPVKKHAVAGPFAQVLPARAPKSNTIFRVPTVPQQAGASTPAVGYVTYSTTGNTGMYSIPTDGVSNAFELIDTVPSLADYTFYSGALVDGAYWCSVLMDAWIVQYVYIRKYDPETWELLETYDMGYEFSVLAPQMAYDNTTGKVYGCFYNTNADGMVFGTIDFDAAMPVTTEIAPLEIGWNGCAVAADGTLYAIDNNGDLYTVNKTNGAMTLVGATGFVPKYMGSAAIDQKTGRFYWNLNPEDNNAYMIEVNPATGEGTLLYECINGEEVQGMYVPAPSAADDAPAAVDDMQAVFEGGSLSGKITFVAPSTTFADEALTGELTYTLLCNGDVAAEGTVAAGAAVEVDVEVAAAGNYTFTAVVANAAGTSPKTKVSLWVGDDCPEAPANVVATLNGNEVTVTWSPVTESVNMGYMGEITYNVVRVSSFDETEVVATGITECQVKETLAKPEMLTAYTYYVIALNGEIESESTASNSVILGDLSAPFELSFADTTTLGLMTIVDVNEDGRTWYQNGSNAACRYSSSNDMDDWLITPVVKLEGGKQYEFYFNTAAYSSYYAERVEAAFGTEPTAAGMTNIIVEPTDLTDTEFVRLSGKVYIETSGDYYFGIHGISDADQFYLLVSDLGLTAGVEATAPAAVADLKVSPNADGENTAVVTFTAPAVDIAGAAIDALDKIEVSVDGTVVETIAPATPGEAYTVNIEVAESDNHTISVVAYNASGAGDAAEAVAYIGVPYPAAPASASIVEQGNTGIVTVTWDPVNTSEEGNPLNPALITYLIVDPANEYEIVAEGLTECTATFQAVTEGQDFVYYYVYAETAKGISTGVSTGMIPVGTPSALPYVESFDNGGITHPLGVNTANGGSWSLFDNTYFDDINDADDTNGYAAMRGSALDASGLLFTGKIALTGQAPKLSFYYYNIAEDDINELNVYVNKMGEDKELLATFVQNEGIAGEWNLAEVDLSAYVGSDVQVTFEGVIEYYTYIMIDAIQIVDPLEYDLALESLQVPGEIKPDQLFEIVADVKNIGINDVAAADYVVEFYNNGELIAMQPGQAIAAGETKTFVQSQIVSILGAEENIFKVVVSYSADLNNDNNEGELPAILVLPNYPTVSNLQATVGSGVELTWDEPDMADLPKLAVTDDFESYEAFSYQNVGDWTLVDADGAPMGGIADLDIPGLTTGVSPLAYFVFNNSDETKFNQSFAAHSGVQFMSTMYNTDGSKQSDWMISPLLSGDAQTISFYAKSYTLNYGSEKFKVHYSTTTTELDQFVEVEEVTVGTDEWTEYSFNIPAGALYFAIECTSKDVFMLFIDDVTYIPAVGESMDLSIVGYMVYRNGMLISNGAVADCNFTDPDGKNGDVYTVTVLYTVGQSAPCESVTAGSTAISGISLKAGVKVEGRTIVVNNAEGQVSIYTVDGKMVYSEAAAKQNTFTAAPGVYVVKSGKLVNKVVVK